MRSEESAHRTASGSMRTGTARRTTRGRGVFTGAAFNTDHFWPLNARPHVSQKKRKSERVREFPRAMLVTLGPIQHNVSPPGNPSFGCVGKRIDPSRLPRTRNADGLHFYYAEQVSEETKLTVGDDFCARRVFAYMGRDVSRPASRAPLLSRNLPGGRPAIVS